MTRISDPDDRHVGCDRARCPLCGEPVDFDDGLVHEDCIAEHDKGQRLACSVAEIERECRHRAARRRERKAG